MRRSLDDLVLGEVFSLKIEPICHNLGMAESLCHELLGFSLLCTEMNPVCFAHFCVEISYI
jgi:hypothetical protein